MYTPREYMILHKFSEAAKDLIRMQGGTPPPHHNLKIVTVESADTVDKSRLIITYEFVPVDTDEHEREADG